MKYNLVHRDINTTQVDKYDITDFINQVIEVSVKTVLDEYHKDMMKYLENAKVAT